jgi:hypothetical protein
VTDAERQRIARIIARLGGAGDGVEDLFKLMGIDMAHEFSLAKLAGEPQTANWAASSGSLTGLFYMLVLYDLAKSDAGVRLALQRAPIGRGVFGIWECDRLGRSVWDALVYRSVQGWKAKGSARQAAEKVFYDVDVSRSHQPIFEQAGRPLFEALRNRISDNAP